MNEQVLRDYKASNPLHGGNSNDKLQSQIQHNTTTTTSITNNNNRSNNQIRYAPTTLHRKWQIDKVVISPGIDTKKFDPTRFRNSGSGSNGGNKGSNSNTSGGGGSSVGTAYIHPSIRVYVEHKRKERESRPQQQDDVDNDGAAVSTMYVNSPYVVIGFLGRLSVGKDVVFKCDIWCRYAIFVVAVLVCLFLLSSYLTVSFL